MQLLDDKLKEQILESIDYGVLALNLNKKITYCNKKAVQMLGMDINSLINMPSPIRFDVPSGGFSKLSVPGLGHVTPLMDSSGSHTGYCLFIKEQQMQKQKKRTFQDIRALILHSLLEKRKTINQIASDIGINWRTVESHLTYLAGKKMVCETPASKHVRIFEITKLGKSKDYR
jgi:predicted transcriptional regulator